MPEVTLPIAVVRNATARASIYERTRPTAAFAVTPARVVIAAQERVSLLPLRPYRNLARLR